VRLTIRKIAEIVNVSRGKAGLFKQKLIFEAEAMMGMSYLKESMMPGKLKYRIRIHRRRER
jgi:hypothetical protein